MNKNRNNILYAIIILLVILTLLAGGYIIYSSINNNETNVNNKNENHLLELIKGVWGCAPADRENNFSVFFWTI